MRGIGWVIFTTFFSFFITSQTSFSKWFEVRVSHTVKCLIYGTDEKKGRKIFYSLLINLNFFFFLLCSSLRSLISWSAYINYEWRNSMNVVIKNSVFPHFLSFTFCWLNNERRDGIITIEYWIRIGYFYQISFSCEEQGEEPQNNATSLPFPFRIHKKNWGCCLSRFNWFAAVRKRFFQHNSWMNM